MAKKGGKKGKVERDLNTFNNSIEAIFKKSKPLTSKEKKSLLKVTEKETKKALKKYNKTQSGKDYMSFVISKNKEAKLNNDKLPIKYGNFEFNIKADYFQKLKDKEKYLDNLYHRKAKSILSKMETPNSNAQAKEMESIMNLYAKKIQGRDFYDKGLVQNIVNKLGNYKDKLNLYVPNKITSSIEETGEVPTTEIYDLVERPVVLDDKLLSLEFLFF